MSSYRYYNPLPVLSRIWSEFWMQIYIQRSERPWCKNHLTNLSIKREILHSYSTVTGHDRGRQPWNESVAMDKNDGSWFVTLEIKINAERIRKKQKKTCMINKLIAIFILKNMSAHLNLIDQKHSWYITSLWQALGGTPVQLSTKYLLVW